MHPILLRLLALVEKYLMVRMVMFVVPMNSQEFSNLMQPGIREVFFNSYDETVTKESMVPRLFRMIGSNWQD